jgi:O-antigen/teichoic acid export membrane protein
VAAAPVTTRGVLMATDLRTRVVSGTFWFGANRLWTQAISWASTLILARLLTPAEYGLVAMALSVVTVMRLMQEYGLGVAIIQRKHLTVEQISAIFWIYLSISGVFTILAFFVAAPAASFYHEPRLVWVVRILSLTFLANAVGTVPYSLLTKAIDLKRRSFAESASVLSASVFTLALAFLGYGFWALVAGQLVVAVVRNLALWYLSGWMPGLRLSFDGMAGIFRFGLTVAGTSGVSQINNVIQTAVVGRVLGSQSLGYYSEAVTLGYDNPAQRLTTSVINQVSLPVFSELQDDLAGLRRYFLQISKYLALVVLPVQAGIALVAHDGISVVLGPKWLPIAPLLQVLTVAATLLVLQLPVAPLLTSRGKPWIAFRLSLWTTIATTGGLVCGIPFGILGVVVAVTLVSSARRIWMIAVALRELQVTFRTYLKNMQSALAATALLAIAVWGVDILFAHSFGATRLIAEVVVGAGVYGTSILVGDKGISADVRILASSLLAPKSA